MTPPVFTEEVVNFLTTSGWQQFWLDEQYYLIPPVDPLSNLCNTTPQTLTHHPFPQLFSPTDKKKLQSFLRKLTPGQNPYIEPAVYTLQIDTSPLAVELLLYSKESDPPGNYAGFIRPLPETLNKNKQNKIEATAQLGKIIADSATLDKLLTTFANHLSQDFGYKSAALLLTNPTETTLTLKSVSGIDFSSISPDALNIPITSHTVAGQVAQTAKALLADDDTLSNYQPVDYLLDQCRCELAVPLVSKGQVVGVLDLQSPSANEYNTDDIAFLSTIANQLAVAIENIRLSEDRDRRMAAELIAFNQLGIPITQQDNLTTIFSNIVNQIEALFKVEAVSLLLLGNNQLRFVASTDPESEKIKSFVLSIGQGIAWSAIQAQKPIRVEDAQTDTRHFGDIDAALDFTTHSLLAVPIQIQDRILGVIEAVNRLDGHPFTREDEATLEFIVSSVAIAIENARLFGEIQRQVDQVEGLLEASGALNTLDLQNILDTIVQRVSVLLKSDHTVVYLANHKAKKLEATAVESSSDLAKVPTPSFDFEQGTVGWVLKHRQPLTINDVANDHRFVFISPESHRVTNLVSTPLIVKDEAIGVLEATHKSNGQDFTPEDEALLLAFANQAAIAIYNARLYRERQRQIRALTIITQASESITKATDLNQLLDVVLDFSLSIIDAEIGAIILVDPQTQILSIETARNIPPIVIDAFNRQNILQDIDIFGKARQTREFVEVNDSSAIPERFIPAEIPFDMPDTFVIVPLFSRDDFIGFIFLQGLPTDNNRTLLKAIIDVAAVAIEKARLFQETNQRLAEVSTLYTLADQLTQVLEFDRIVESSVTIIKHALDCTGCCVYLKEFANESPSLTLKACSGWLKNEPEGSESEYVSELAASLIANPYPLYIADVQEERTNISDDKAGQLGSVMVMPLLVKEELLGALSIYDVRPRAFGADEGRLLTIAAVQISTAIENSRLYDHLEQRATELEIAIHEVEEANRLTTEFVENVSHELRTPLTFIKAYVALILDNELGKIPQAARDKLEIVSQKTRSIIRLVEDLVSLQKIETDTLRFESVAVHDFMTRVVQWARASADEHNIEIIAKSSPALPNIQVDVDRLGQVFDNLVGNALKFSSTAGKIYITAQQEGTQIKFSVKDTGIGIAPEKLDKIFERFYQIKRDSFQEYSGAGLGLTIVKQIIEAHQGHILVESEPGKGTTFSFWLPVDESVSTTN
jgi:GAF domain-containing protein